MDHREPQERPVVVELKIEELTAIYNSLETAVELFEGDMGAAQYEVNPGDLAKDIAARRALSAKVWGIIKEQELLEENKEAA